METLFWIEAGDGSHNHGVPILTADTREELVAWIAEYRPAFKLTANEQSWWSEQYHVWYKVHGGLKNISK